jgi:ubiquitin-conjugating enzyme E2 J1
LQCILCSYQQYQANLLLPHLSRQFKPPHILFLTPSGRFDTNTKVCLSFSAFHPELWQPAWGIRLILEALIAFLPSPADGAIGSLDWTSAERKKLAKKSVGLCCLRCGKVAELLPELKKEEGEETATKKKPSTRFEKEIEQLRLAQAANETKNAEEEEDKAQEEESSESVTQTEVEEEPETSITAPSVASEESPTPTPTPPPAPTAPVEDNRDDVEIEVQDDDDVTPEHIVPQNAANPFEIDISWLTDPMLNVAIVLLASICFLVARKSAALLDELQSLDVKIAL